MSTSKPTAATAASEPPAGATNQSPSRARRLWRFALAGRAAAALLAGIEWVDASIRLTPVFATFGERLIFTAYFSLSLLSGTSIGLAVGAAFIIGIALRDRLARLAGRGKVAWPHRSGAAVIVCGVFAFALNQQWYAHRFVLTLIREAEKFERLNAVLLSHERATSYLVMFALLIFAAILGWLARTAARFPFWLRAALIAALAVFAL